MKYRKLIFLLVICIFIQQNGFALRFTREQLIQIRVDKTGMDYFNELKSFINDERNSIVLRCWAIEALGARKSEKGFKYLNKIFLEWNNLLAMTAYRAISKSYSYKKWSITKKYLNPNTSLYMRESLSADLDKKIRSYIYQKSNDHKQMKMLLEYFRKLGKPTNIIVYTFDTLLQNTGEQYKKEISQIYNTILSNKRNWTYGSTLNYGLTYVVRKHKLKECLPVVRKIVMNNTKHVKVLCGAISALSTIGTKDDIKFIEKYIKDPRKDVGLDYDDFFEVNVKETATQAIKMLKKK